MSTTPVRVALYVKARTPEAAGQRETLLGEYVAGMPGWDVTEVFTDLGRSVHRRALDRTFTSAKSGGFDLLLVDTLDDLTRAPRLRHIVERFQAANVTVRSRIEKFDSANPLALLMASVIDACNEYRYPARPTQTRDPRPVTEPSAPVPPSPPQDGELVAVRALYAVVCDERLGWLDELLISAGVSRRCGCMATAAAHGPCPLCGLRAGPAPAGGDSAV